MAIMQSSLAEELISRQERAVLRGVFRASQLSDALVALDKISGLLSDGAQCGQTPPADLIRLRSYLRSAVLNALAATKSPATHPETSTPSSQGSVA